MADNEYSRDNYRSLKMLEYWNNNKSREMLRFVCYHLKTKKMFKNVVKKCPFQIRCVSGKFKTPKIVIKLFQKLRERESLFLMAAKI